MTPSSFSFGTLLQRNTVRQAITSAVQRRGFRGTLQRFIAVGHISSGVGGGLLHITS